MVDVSHQLTHNCDPRSGLVLLLGRFASLRWVMLPLF